MLRELVGGERATLILHDPAGDRYDDELYPPDEFDEDSDERFINFAFLSNIAVQLRDKVQRGTHVKGGVPYPQAFTGKDIVVCSHVVKSRSRPAEHPSSQRCNLSFNVSW
jgi:hypothetical protein